MRNDSSDTQLVFGVWDRMMSDSCRWYQVLSRVDGKMWEEHWMMHWLRAWKRRLWTKWGRFWLFDKNTCGHTSHARGPLGNFAKVAS
jgi:hypothetical protein